MRLHWHRHDLRVTDNWGLSAADDVVLPVFVFDDEILQFGSPPRVAFMLDALAALRADYREQGGDLYLAHGDPSAVLPDLATEVGAATLSYTEDYSGLAAERDRVVTEALDSEGITVEGYHDALHHEPGSITTNAGDPYSVYTYFWTKWRNREKADPYDPPEQVVDRPGDALPALADLGFDEPVADIEPAGTGRARERLADFCAGPIYDYADRRDYPADECTSRLSTHLRWGTIGVREVYAATDRAMADAPDADARESVEAFQSQLAWREFYHHVLNFTPEVVTQNYKSYEQAIEWRDDQAEIAAWKAGETGYPIVDAGMRQLREEAYMHNRVRMIVASFLTKDLLADWRHGYAHFREHLVDHNTANDNGGWQWAASTGTDAQPYFRIFNPTTQGERYDPDAAYIHEYVPELAGVSAETIHAWPDLSPSERRDATPDYPDPIVDHGERREQAVTMFKRARGEDPDE
ncbi:cryptochrome/photolyase family protein [Halorarius litoreus]|uniref:cryptochrome/photolyase family protein n=1 Tax=Halorarius litoreus TaxID=2962676 RepID=UPI0020CC4E44|nr:deoxyribodipyrimidine photo-lyase [Halorarius litoreus]